jgi:hypothetical protein
MVQGWGVADRKVVTCPLFVACHSYLRRSLTTLSLKLKMTDSPNTTDIVHPLVSSLELEPGLLYAVLTYRGDLASWNWSFFVPNPSVFPIGADGTVFHVVSDSDTPGEWKFEMENKDVVGSPLVVVIVRLGDVACLGDYEDVVGGDGLLPMFKTLAIPASGSGHRTEFSSRTWFLDAICVLHDCGVINCDDVWLLEREIRRCAFTAMDKYLQNKGWTVYEAERCS